MVNQLKGKVDDQKVIIKYAEDRATRAERGAPATPAPVSRASELRQQTPITIASADGHVKRSAKVPDPQQFTDGKDVKWDMWRL